MSWVLSTSSAAAATATTTTTTTRKRTTRGTGTGTQYLYIYNNIDQHDIFTVNSMYNIIIISYIYIEQLRSAFQATAPLFSRFSQSISLSAQLARTLCATHVSLALVGLGFRFARLWPSQIHYLTFRVWSWTLCFSTIGGGLHACQYL